MSKAGKETDPRVSLDEYNPLNWRDVVLMVEDDIPIPKHDELVPDQVALWKTTMNLKGTIFSNLIHVDYPDAYCQVQISFNKIGIGNVYIQHHGPREAHIPERLVNTIFLQEMAPQIFGESEERSD